MIILLGPLRRKCKQGKNFYTFFFFLPISVRSHPHLEGWIIKFCMNVYLFYLNLENRHEWQKCREKKLWPRYRRVQSLNKRRWFALYFHFRTVDWIHIYFFSACDCVWLCVIVCVWERERFKKRKREGRREWKWGEREKRMRDWERKKEWERDTKG